MADLRGYEALRAKFEAIGPRQGLMRQLGLAGVREAKFLVPRKTGNLGRNIRVGRVGASNVEIVATTNYAAAVELGTRPHVITPRARKALRFAVGVNRRLSGSPRKGAPVIFAKRVNHPGTKAHPYLVPGLRKAAEGIGGQIIDQWNKAS
jgi:hypothetical protein